MAKLASWLQGRWYSTAPSPIWLRPLAWLFWLIARSRKNKLLAKQWRAPIPVVVIGNIAVGGTGKTPLVITLVEGLIAAGHCPAVISRGYGGTLQGPLSVSGHSPTEVGDEPVLISQRTGAPVVIGSQRCDVIKLLLEEHPQVDVILSDDGLQHYAMARDFECVVIDGARGLGNGSCLPAGPLREPAARLTSVDHIVINGSLEVPLPAGDVPQTLMTLEVTRCRNLKTNELRPLSAFADQHVHAVAGIGNPQRFFNTLESASIDVAQHPYPDHHAYHASDICFSDGLAVLMTEKDAVKCIPFANETHWAVAVDARLTGTLLESIIEKIQ